MADADALRYLRIAKADLSFFAVQCRYDDDVEIQPPDWPSIIKIAEALLAKAERQLKDG